MSKYTRRLRREFAKSQHAAASVYAPEEEEPVPQQRAVAKLPTDVSVQPRFTNQASVFSSVYQWVKLAELEEPIYAVDSTTRDKWLRQFVLREPHLAGVLNSVTQVDGNRGWTLTGGRNQVNRFTEILHDNYFVTPDTFGWRPGIKSAALSYYCSDLGAVTEIGRDGQDGPLRGLFHVDSARCRLSGIPETPLYYQPLGSGQQAWSSDDYFRITSMVSTDEAMRGLGFCAVSRCLELAKVMVAVYLHDQEQLGARAPRGLLLLKNITQTAWDEAMASREEKMDVLERKYYGGLAVLAGMGADDVDAKLLALSQLPLNFDLEKFTSLLMYGYALAFGYDPREFWPVSGGQLGTATETEVQHMKATGKGGLDFALAHQEHLQRLLPPTLQFEIEQRDDQGAILEAQLEQAQAAGPLGLYNTGLTTGASVISREEVRILLAERGLIPEEWTQYEEEVTSTDIETAEQTQDAPVPTDNAAPDTVPAAAPDATVPPAAQRALDSDPVRRAMRQFPTEDIIQRHWPSGKTSVLWRPGRKQWRGLGGGQRSTSPKEVEPPEHGNSMSVSGSEHKARLVRDIAEAQDNYRSGITDIVERLAGGGDLRSASTSMRQLIKGMADQVYAEGMREGGIRDAEAQMDESDLAAISDWVAGQLPFVTDFLKAVKEEGQTGEMLGRIELWVGALGSLGHIALMSAQQNMMVTWEYGDTVEHCSTCSMLHGKRHRLKWFRDQGYIPREPASETLSCGGWGCDCRLVDDNGEQVI